MNNWNKVVKIEFEYVEVTDRYYMILIYENGEEEKKRLQVNYIKSIIGIKERERKC